MAVARNCWAVIGSLLLMAGLPGDLTAQDALTVQKLKNLVEVDGMGPMELQSYGVVTGLNGTGDSAGGETETLIRNLLAHSSDHLVGKLTIKNCALVMVSTRIIPFQKPGTFIDVRVSAAGDSSSLAGGLLESTNLYNAIPRSEPGGGVTYAVARGMILVDGAGRTGNPRSGIIPSGAAVKEEWKSKIERVDPTGRKFVTLNLRRPDFNLASRIAEAINLVPQFSYIQSDTFGNQVRNLVLASVSDPGAVRVEVLTQAMWTNAGIQGDYPGYEKEPVTFVDRLLVLDVALPTVPRKAVVTITNEAISSTSDVIVRPGWVRSGAIRVGLDKESTLEEILKDVSKVATHQQQVDIVRALDAAGLLEAEVRSQ